ncbi:MAG TPA: nuclear transport factor 2 family protein [Actinomycetota bacterium]|nr:nuclear transport factor 2 family protein [Actinomycetota bacterium]
MADPTLSERLRDAMNAHDLEAFVACFHQDYDSRQPAHPARSFVGKDQVRKNWSLLFESIPDFRAELVRLAVQDGVEWAEWHWQGTKANGMPLDERGVMLMGIRDGLVAWGRLYVEEVEQVPVGIDETVARMAGRMDPPTD